MEIVRILICGESLLDGDSDEYETIAASFDNV